MVLIYLNATPSFDFHYYIAISVANSGFLPTCFALTTQAYLFSPHEILDEPQRANFVYSAALEGQLGKNVVHHVTKLVQSDVQSGFGLVIISNTIAVKSIWLWALLSF